MLADKARSTSSVVHETVRELEKVLRSTGSKRGKENASTAHCNQLIQQLLDQLDEHNRMVGEGLNRLTESSESIGREVSQAIIALQFQDSVNQRIDHVVTALREICDTLQPHVSGADQQSVSDLTEQWRDRLASNTTMNSERGINDSADYQDVGGDIELF